MRRGRKWTPAILRARHGAAAVSASRARPPSRFRVYRRREDQQLQGRRPAVGQRGESPAQIRVSPSLASGRRGRDTQQDLHHIAEPAAWTAALAAFLCPPPPQPREPSWWRPRTCRRKVGARAAPVGGRHCAGQPAAVLHVAEDSGHRADKQHLAAAHSSVGHRCAAFGGAECRARIRMRRVGSLTGTPSQRQISAACSR